MVQLSLFSEQYRPTASGSIDLGNNYFTLQQQYTKTAQELINKKNTKRAAFVYMKLLKQYHQAADTLEQGKLYQEAATVHLNHTGNKLKAAQCYEKGKMTNEAINLFKELNEHEKVGDLYMSINNQRSGLEHYNMVLDQLKDQHQYVKASLLCRNRCLICRGARRC